MLTGYAFPRWRLLLLSRQSPRVQWTEAGEEAAFSKLDVSVVHLHSGDMWSPMRAGDPRIVSSKSNTECLTTLLAGWRKSDVLISYHLLILSIRTSKKPKYVPICQRSQLCLTGGFVWNALISSAKMNPLSAHTADCCLLHQHQHVTGV